MALLPRAFPRRIGRLGALDVRDRFPIIDGPPRELLPHAGSRAAKTFERARRMVDVNFVNQNQGRLPPRPLPLGRVVQLGSVYGTGTLYGKRKARKLRTKKRASGRITCRTATFVLRSGKKVKRKVCRDSLGRLVAAKKRASRTRKRRR